MSLDHCLLAQGPDHEVQQNKMPGYFENLSKARLPCDLVEFVLYLLDSGLYGRYGNHQ